MNKKVWGKVTGIGELFLDEELVVGVETILFTCADSENNRYLFMTYDSYEGRYVFVKINDQRLINMLEGEIAIEKVFRQSGSIYLTSYRDGVFEVESIKSSEFDKDMLPDKDVFYTIKSDYILRYIERLRNNTFIDLNYLPVAISKCSNGTLMDSNYEVNPCSDDNDFICNIRMEYICMDINVSYVDAA